MPSSEQWLIRRAEVRGAVVDCRIALGQVVALAPGLPTEVGERVMDAAGGALIPGLADHHIHVLAAAAARMSIDLREVGALADAPDVPGDGWVRVIGADSGVTRRDLDDRWPERPVKVQHRSGALWTLNTRATEELGESLTADQRSSGQLWRADEQMSMGLKEADDSLGLNVAELGEELASFGVTHVMDASPHLDAAGLGRVRRDIRQHVLSMGPSGEGPRKLVIADHDLSSFESIRDQIATWHTRGRPVAVHAVSSAALALCLAAFSDAGSIVGDRIEHAAECDDAAARRIAELGLVVVTQPTIFSRGCLRMMAEVRDDERAMLWRHAGLLAQGVRVVVSSDAPYGDLAPARTLQACEDRPVEGVSTTDALVSYLLDPMNLHGPARAVIVGAPADLCVMSSPLGEALSSAARTGEFGVRATFISGELVHPVAELAAQDP